MPQWLNGWPIDHKKGAGVEHFQANWKHLAARKMRPTSKSEHACRANMRQAYSNGTVPTNS
jgi:hypothetical protein